jgi:hypothetical protein
MHPSGAFRKGDGSRLAEIVRRSRTNSATPKKGESSNRRPRTSGTTGRKSNTLNIQTTTRKLPKRKASEAGQTISSSPLPALPPGPVPSSYRATFHHPHQSYRPNTPPPLLTAQSPLSSYSSEQSTSSSSPVYTSSSYTSSSSGTSSNFWVVGSADKYGTQQSPSTQGDRVVPRYTSNFSFNNAGHDPTVSVANQQGPLASSSSPPRVHLPPAAIHQIVSPSPRAGPSHYGVNNDQYGIHAPNTVPTSASSELELDISRTSSRDSGSSLNGYCSAFDRSPQEQHQYSLQPQYHKQEQYPQEQHEATISGSMLPAVSGGIRPGVVSGAIGTGAEQQLYQQQQQQQQTPFKLYQSALRRQDCDTFLYKPDVNLSSFANYSDKDQK